jgi:hypothetical protein
MTSQNLNSYVTRNGPLRDIFPCLMEGNGFIALFHAPGKGTVVATDGRIYEVGYYSEAWATETFTPFVGSVTIGDPSSVGGDDGISSGPIDLGTLPLFEDKTQAGNTGWCGEGCTCFPDPRTDGDQATQTTPPGFVQADADNLPSEVKELIAAFRGLGLKFEVVSLG